MHYTIEITTAARLRWNSAITGRYTKLTPRSRVDTAQHNTLSQDRHPTTMTFDIQNIYVRQAVLGRNTTSTLSLHSSMAWKERCAHTRWNLEEGYPQPGTHFHNFAEATLAQRPEFVRGSSSRTFVPKVDVGVAPYEEAATKP